MFRHAFLAIFAASLAATAAAAQDLKGLRVCLVSGSLEYESNKTMPILQARLEKLGATCTRAFLEGKDETKLPGLDNLDKADVMVLYTRRLKLAGDDLERFKKYCLSGKSIIGIRTASHAVQTWLDLDREVFGGDYKGHFGKTATKVEFPDANKSHPILAGVEPFTSDGSLYKNEKIAADCVVLLNGNNGVATQPVAWTRAYKGGRIFYTSLGHQKDFENASFLRLLENGVAWVAKK